MQIKPDHCRQILLQNRVILGRHDLDGLSPNGVLTIGVIDPNIPSSDRSTRRHSHLGPSGTDPNRILKHDHTVQTELHSDLEVDPGNIQNHRRAVHYHSRVNIVDRRRRGDSSAPSTPSTTCADDREYRASIGHCVVSYFSNPYRCLRRSRSGHIPRITAIVGG